MSMRASRSGGANGAVIETFGGFLGARMAFQRLLLVDGTAVMYRAFYAIPDLKTRSGQPTNAVYGFIRMMRQLLAGWRPTHAVVAFDGGIPEERRSLLETYKAQRKPMPHDMRRQIPFVEEYLRLSGTALERVEGQEADDVIATLAVKAEHLFEKILVATSDKDMFQLVSGKVSIVPVSGPGAGKTAMGPQDVVARTGVSPSRIVEWLALTGDASDNIPGIRGVGAKTAAALLNQFESLDELLRRTKEIRSEKVRAALEAGRDIILRNVEMIRLRTGIDVGFGWEQYECREGARRDLRNFFERMEFRSLVGEIDSSGDLFEGLEAEKDV